MIVSPEKIKKIREIIKLRYNALIVKMGGPSLLTDEEIKELIELELITPEEAGLIKEAYFIGRVRNDLQEPRKRTRISLAEFARKQRDAGLPIGDVEKFALEGAASSIGSNIANLGDKTRSAVEGIINNVNLDYRNELLGEEGLRVLETGWAEHKTLQEIQSELRKKTGDFFRDWKRVAVTETTNAMNMGEADAIVGRNKGADPNEIYVFKQVTNDEALCEPCKNAYLMPESKTPRVFKLSELKANGSNYGKKKSEYQPVLGVMHPQCRCSLAEIPKGFGFEENSSVLTYKGPDYIYKNPQ